MLIIDKFSQKFLKHLNTYQNPSEYIHTFFEEDLTEMANKIDSDVGSIRSVIKYLEEKGYISLVHDKNNKTYGFYLSHKGLHFKEISKNEKIETLLKGVLLPVIASLITSLIVVACSYLWTMSGIKTSNTYKPSNAPNTLPTIQEIHWVKNI